MAKTDWGRILNIISNVENNTLSSEIDYFRNKLSVNERKELLIVEKQHVAGFKYDVVLDDIIAEWVIASLISKYKKASLKELWCKEI